MSFISSFSIYRGPANKSKYPQPHDVDQWNEHQQAPPATMPGSAKYSPHGDDNDCKDKT
jgi:hypothetical protein